MSNWRRQTPRITNNSNHRNHQRNRTISQSSKPPIANSKHSVPAWEKEFCAVIGSIPWWKVLEAKKFMYLYDKVIQWDDSAGEESFKNAKSRYWAKINDLPCDLSLPDPDIYIDDIDWDAEVDDELILDLDRDLDPIKEEGGVVILDSLLLSEHFKGLGYGIGWGDAASVKDDENKPKNSWDDQQCNGLNDDSWGIKEKTESWDQKNSFKTESWDQKNSFKNESWDYKKNKNSFKNESWDHKKSYNYNNNYNSFNRKNNENWKYKDQNREWRKKGEVQDRDRVEDCRFWRNGTRGRSRGGFQQHSSNRNWTETF